MRRQYGIVSLLAPMSISVYPLFPRLGVAGVIVGAGSCRSLARCVNLKYEELISSHSSFLRSPFYPPSLFRAHFLGKQTNASG